MLASTHEHANELETIQSTDNQAAGHFGWSHRIE